MGPVGRELDGSPALLAPVDTDKYLWHVITPMTPEL